MDLYHICWLASSERGHIKDLACFGAGDIDSTVVNGYPLGEDTIYSGNDEKMLQGTFCEEIWYGLLDSEFQLAPHSDAALTPENDIFFGSQQQMLIPIAITIIFLTTLLKTKENGICAIILQRVKL